MKDKYFKPIIVVFLIFFSSILSYAQLDSTENIDTTMFNTTFKKVLEETKKGLSREQISFTIILSISASILAIIIFIIRKKRREAREFENQ